jgi:hypothetical protein
MKNSFVAFFDILGFNNIVEKNNHEDLIALYNYSLYETLDLTDNIITPIHRFITPEAEKESLDIMSFVISDSIILVQNNYTQRGLLNLIAKSQALASIAMSDGIPVRGGISFGPVTVLQNKRGTTIVGSGLTKAYKIEVSQQWSGGIVDKECFDLFPFVNGKDLIQKLLEDKVNPLIIKYNVPLKASKFKVGYCINWPQNRLLKNEEDIRAAFLKHKKEIPTEKEKEIVENSVKFFKHVRNLLQS